MKKIKFLILALLGITIIPSAYAVPLDFSIYWYYTRFNETKVISTICDTGTPPYFNYYQCNLNAGNTPHSNFVKSTYNQFEFAYSTPSGVVTVPWLYARDIWESREFVRSYFTESWDQKHNSITLSSRTAYQYIAPDGRKFTFTQVFFHPYQFTLYDPVSKNSLTFLWKNKLINSILLANPKLNTDNVRLVDLHARKAWSITMEQQSARDILLGRNLSADYLKTLQFSKSYTVFEWWQKITPGSWVNEYYSQWSWFIYTLDVDFVAPKWSTPDTNTGNVAAVEYGKCANYRSDIKNLAYYSQKCWDDPVDDETQNWVRVDSWNWSWDVQFVLQQLTWANKNKCWRFANAKKQHWEKYKDEREKFTADFRKYARTAESIDIQWLCKSVELEHGAPDWKLFWSWLLQSWKSLFESLSNLFSKDFYDKAFHWELIGIFNGVNYKYDDYYSDLTEAIALYRQCEWYGAGGRDSSPGERDMYACSLYSLKLGEMSQKLNSLGNSWFTYSWFVDIVKNSKQNISIQSLSGVKDFWESLWDKIYGLTYGPFLSWYNHAAFIQCNSSLHVEAMDIFAYVFFVIVFLYFFKLL